MDLEKVSITANGKTTEIKGGLTTSVPINSYFGFQKLDKKNSKSANSEGAKNGQ